MIPLINSPEYLDDYVVDTNLVFLWSEIELFIQTFLQRWLQVEENVFEAEIFSKIRIDKTIQEFEELDDESKAEYYVNLLRTKISYAGLADFMFKAFHELGLGTNDTRTEKEIEKVLRQLQETRNIIIHCDKRIDEKFLRKCPWLNQSHKEGENLDLSHDDKNDFWLAAIKLFREVQIRLETKFPQS